MGQYLFGSSPLWDLRNAMLSEQDMALLALGPDPSRVMVARY